MHHADGFDLLAWVGPGRLTLPLDRWLPARVLASFTWPVASQRVEQRGDGITYYQKARAVDVPLLVTRSIDSEWFVASFAQAPGNIWSNPELTCQHVDPQAPLPPQQRVVLEVKMLVMRGSLDDALRLAIRQRAAMSRAGTVVVHPQRPQRIGAEGPQRRQHGRRGAGERQRHGRDEIRDRIRHSTKNGAPPSPRVNASAPARPRIRPAPPAQIVRRSRVRMIDGRGAPSARRMPTSLVRRRAPCDTTPKMPRRREGERQQRDAAGDRAHGARHLKQPRMIVPHQAHVRQDPRARPRGSPAVAAQARRRDRFAPARGGSREWCCVPAACTLPRRPAPAG